MVENQRDSNSRAGSGRRIPSSAVSVATIVAIVLIWFGVTNTGLVAPDYLPSPQALGTRFISLIKDGYQNVGLDVQIEASLSRTLIGFVIGSTLGVGVGLAAGYSRLVSAAISPLMSFIRPIPPIAFIPMVVLYFGLGETGYRDGYAIGVLTGTLDVVGGVAGRRLEAGCLVEEREQPVEADRGTIEGSKIECTHSISSFERHAAVHRVVGPRLRAA